MVFVLLENDTWAVKMKPVEFVIKEGDEHLASHSGMALIGTLLEHTELGSRVSGVTMPGLSGAQDTPRRYCEIDDRIVVYGKT